VLKIDMTDKEGRVFANAKEKMQITGLSAGFGKKKVLNDVSISFKENAVTAIIGPSGCGKSTRFLNGSSHCSAQDRNGIPETESISYDVNIR